MGLRISGSTPASHSSQARRQRKEKAMPRVVHFELPVDEPERAAHFYRSVFGWQINKWEGPEDYWLIKTGEQEGRAKGTSSLIVSFSIFLSRSRTKH
jgi:hypothetical protein